MFTGLVNDIGQAIEIKKKNNMLCVRIQTQFYMPDIKIGASIACDGCCLTVIDKGQNWFDVEISDETLSKTILGTWREKQKINLEQSLKLGDELGGHLVSGHIDSVASVIDITENGDTHKVLIKIPEGLAAYIAPKGSVTLNGISFTINHVHQDSFDICIIPHTWISTNAQHWKPGTDINLEVDMLARYVAQILGKQH